MNGVGPKTNRGLGISEHGCYMGLHVSPKTFCAPVLAMGIRARKTLKVTFRFAHLGERTMCINSLIVRLDKVDGALVVRKLA